MPTRSTAVSVTRQAMIKPNARIDSRLGERTAIHFLECRPGGCDPRCVGSISRPPSSVKAARATRVTTKGWISRSGGGEEGRALSVRGGEMVLVMPAGTSEDHAVQAASTLRGSLRLETGRVLTFEIHDGAVGAFFEDESAELFDRRESTP